MGTPRRHYDELDGYRGLAALFIVVYHAYMDPRALGASYPQQGLAALMTVRNLDAAVSWFFVLSGFVVSLPFVRAALHQSGQVEVRDYLRRRALRLLPLYYAVALTVTILGWRGRPGTTPRDWQDLAIHMIFGQLFDERHTFTLVGPAWSLAVEVSYYLMLAALGPLAYVLCRRLGSMRARAAALATGCLTLIALSVIYRAAPWHPNHPASFPLDFLDIFALGMLLAIAATAWDRAVFEARAILACRIAAAVLCAIAFVLRLTGPFWYTAFHSLCGVAFALLLATTILGPRDTPFVRALGHRIPATLGAISYGVYLWHQPLLFALAGGWIIRAAPGSFALDTLVLATISIVLASATYLLIERPLQHRRLSASPTLNHQRADIPVGS